MMMQNSKIPFCRSIFPMGTQKDFSEYYPQSGHALSRRFASPGPQTALSLTGTTLPTCCYVLTCEHCNNTNIFSCWLLENSRYLQLQTCD